MMKKLFGLALLLAGLAQAQTVTAVPKLDLGRFSSTWYEIARYPTKAEKKCVRDGLQLFASGEKAGRLEQVNSCVYKNGFANVQNINLRLKDKRVPDGRLETSFLFLFHRKQWVLALGDDYQWALLGSPNHKQLWVLSATPAMDPAVLAGVKARAAAEGFDPAKLVMVPQTK
jgi:apolipoprotein D and lipocalin family protein